MTDFKFENGQEVEDVVSGFRGIVVARHDYSTGGARYSVLPHVKDDGSYVDDQAFDEDRLRLVH